MRSAMTVVVLGAVLALAMPARADWDVGDGHKMHYPQLPDPNGYDVRLSYSDTPVGGLGEYGRILADDWKCSGTGPLTDVHFWGSWKGDLVGTITQIDLMVFRDDPNPQGGYSQPLSPNHAYMQVLPNMFTIRDWGVGDQSFYDPWGDNDQDPVPYHKHNDHQNIYQVNIDDVRLAWGPNEPFIQQEGEIYWLALEIHTLERDRRFGWKTSGSPQFLDDAVFSAGQWVPLTDPDVDPGSVGASLDLAFVITPEPATLALLGLGAAGLVARRKK